MYFNTISRIKEMGDPLVSSATPSCHSQSIQGPTLFDFSLQTLLFTTIKPKIKNSPNKLNGLSSP